MSSGECIPEGLALMAPGPELASALAGIDVSVISGFDVIAVLQARYRQLSHEHAKFLEVVVESGVRSDQGFGRAPYPDEFAADEVRAALVLTRRAAEELYWGGVDLSRRLPAVHAALSGGVLDAPRARVFREWTVNLTPDQARGICDLLLPEAGSLTTGQLIERIKRLAIAIDPDWTRRQYDEAVVGRRVLTSTNPDGTANLEGRQLPVEQVAATAAHLSRLARALRRAGDPRTLDQLRADLLAALTDGTTTGLTETALISHLRRDGDAARDTVREPIGPTGEPEYTTRPGGVGEPGYTGESVEEMAEPVGTSEPDDRSDAGSPLVPRSQPPGSAGAPGAAGYMGAAGAQIVVRARLTTLVGLDRFPGELAGTGPIHAELVRDLVRRMGSAQWRFALTDPDGRLLHTGLITARPSGESRRAVSRGIVELQLRDCDLDALTNSDDSAGWAPVVDDIACSHRAWMAGATGAGGAAGASPVVRPGDDPHRRRPGAVLRRLLEARDGRCFFPGCRNPATNAQIDHTIRWTDRGPTVEPNLGAGCTHDHRLKDEGGWRVTQSEPGHFRWISRLGHHYHRPRALVIEAMPEPRGRDMRGEQMAATGVTGSCAGWLAMEDVLHHAVRPPRPPPDDHDPPF